MKKELPITLLGLLFLSFINSAQAQKRNNYKINKIYAGIELQAGTRLFPNSFSNIAQLQNLDAKGGSFGFVIGKNHWSGHIRGAGYYASPISDCSSIKLFESQILVDFHLLQYLNQNSKFDIYPTFGAGIMRYEFVEQGDAGNTCVAKTFARANLGAGVLYKLVERYSFVHVFAEFYVSPALSDNQPEIDDIEQNARQVTMLNVGLRLGRVFSR